MINHSMIKTRPLKNVVVFIQTILSCAIEKNYKCLNSDDNGIMTRLFTINHSLIIKTMTKNDIRDAMII